MKGLRDPFWQFIGAIVGVLSIISSFLVDQSNFSSSYVFLVIAAIASISAAIIQISVSRSKQRSHGEAAKKIIETINTVGAQNVVLEKRDLQEYKLISLDLTGLNARGANLAYSNLSGSILREANLSYAKLQGAELINTDFSRADLSYADFSGANLMTANLTQANIRGSNFSKALLTGATFENTTYDQNTTWPSEIDVTIIKGVVYVDTTES